MKPKLLLADDSVTIQRVIELTFADEDVDVVAVGDGQLAIDRLEADPPDIVLADVDMPKRDGYEVAAYIKSRPKLAHIPVVLLTGAFEPVDQARAERAGSSDVLAKPFEPQMVINRVKQLLGRKTENEEREAAAVRPATRPQASAVAVADDKPATAPAAQSRAVPPAPSTAAAPPSRTKTVEEEPVSLDDYFDQLDAAFSNLQSSSVATDVGTMQAEQDWIDSQKRADGAVARTPVPNLKDFQLPDLSIEEAISVSMAPASVRPVAPSMPESPEPAPPVSPSPAPMAVHAPVAPPPPAPMADTPVEAVKPVEAAESAEAPGPAPAPPVRTTMNPFAEAAAARAAASVAITDEVIEEVVSRVLQRLTDRVVRETVTEIVSQTAERLVREEIERIKSEGQ
jgi:CheY-like chemotaxis protein